MVFNPRETADNLKKSGAFIPGIRPGEQTAKYIDKVMTRLTLAGALYITFICLVPQFLMTAMNVQFYFGGTSLLIIVVVIMDFMAQVQTHLMSHQYGDVMKNQPQGVWPVIGLFTEFKHDEGTRASVKTICRNCKIIKRHGVVRVICTEPKHKQRQG